MTDHSVDEVADFFEELYKDEYGSERSITVRRAGRGYTVTIKQMYEYVPLNFGLLCKVSEFFGTKNINDSRYGSQGCDTCDFGSSYEVTLTIEPD